VNTARLSAGWQWSRRAWDRVAIYLPVILMGLMALGTYWLARNTPNFLGGADTQRRVTHEPDYFMRGFSVKTFDANGRLKTEVFGTEARHYPDTDTMEIDNPRIRSYNATGELTTATALHGISNADGSEVQLMGNAIVTREPNPARGTPRMQLRSEFIHAFVNTERVKSHQPVEIIRGNDRFTADSMDYDNLERVMDLQGRVRGILVPAPAASAARR
jgi:lipopolysaccharide export system protein LptC